MKKAYALWFCLLSLLSGNAQNKFSPDLIQDTILHQLKLFPQEKIHLHTDRDYYVPGEKIWFKAYITDAATHQSPTNSRYVYVELIDPTNSLVNRVMIHPVADMYYGHLFLSEIIPEGYYTLRAYTRYMENMSDDYFFKKNIRIGKLPSENPIAEKKNRRKQSKDDYDVSFFPEGGYLPEETFCKVAFKVLNKNGAPASITGNIVNEKDSVITSVNTLHAGMGSFTFFPEAEKKYYLESQNAQGLKKRFQLPAAHSNAYTLSTSQNKNHHYISVKKSAGTQEKSLYLLIHCRGAVLYYDSWNFQKEHIGFAKDLFPSGVIQIVLFDQEMNPLSERLIFNKNEEQDQIKAAFTTDKTNYRKREKVTATLSFADLKNTPLTGSLSVAITDDKDIAIDSLTTIASSLLLVSELKGHIESPGYYLQNDNKAEAALDLLMMTHGWRRYNIPEVIKGNLTYPRKPFEVSQVISGKVKSLVLGKPVEKSEVTFFIPGGYLEQTETDENGNFFFNGFEFPDTTTFFVQSLGKKGSSRVELILNEESFPELKYARSTPYFPEPVYVDQNANRTIDENKNGFIKKAEQRAKYDENMRIVHLKEIEVTAKRIDKKDEIRLQYWANTGSDKTIYRERIEQINPIFVSDMLNEVGGVTVYSDGRISIRRGELPLVLIDGMPVEWPEEFKNPHPLFAHTIARHKSPLELVSVHDVESIDIFKGASAAIFGVRGTNGAISITTRRGGDNNYSGIKNFNHTAFIPLGYQEAAEFYSPEYETPEANHLTIPDYRTTIFWKPDLVFSEEGNASFEFYTSDFPTTYSVIIEGLTSDGKIIRQVEKIHVNF